jgi:hypothetical protein
MGLDALLHMHFEAVFMNLSAVLCFLSGVLSQIFGFILLSAWIFVRVFFIFVCTLRFVFFFVGFEGFSFSNILNIGMWAITLLTWRGTRGSEIHKSSSTKDAARHSLLGVCRNDEERALKLLVNIHHSSVIIEFTTVIGR